MHKKSTWLKLGALLLGGGTVFQCFGGCLKLLNPCGGDLPDLSGFWKGLTNGWPTDMCWLNQAIDVLHEELLG